MTVLRTRLVTVMAAIVAAASTLGAQTPETAGYQGTQLEIFLREAKITAMAETETGITRPSKSTLETSELTHPALFKTVDILKRGTTRFPDGSTEFNFQDSWKFEVAAYELDKMIGLDMIPATVERRYKGDRGSMQWWIDDARSELDRANDRIPYPDPSAWAKMLYNMRLFDALIYNVDRNATNILISPDWRICLIDHSRSFRDNKELRAPEGLTRFSRSLLDGIRRLDQDMLKERLNDYLTPFQIRGILARRDLILEHAAKFVAERGEDVALYN